VHIFVTGASGYIGLAVSKALIAQGHQVNGLTRSTDGAAKLHAAGIVPVVGNLTDTALLTASVQAADAVIHTAASRAATDRVTIDLVAIEAMLSALAGSHKMFILTSGTSVYRDTGDQAVTEDMPIDAPSHMVWRVTTETRVLSVINEHVHSIVIRPTIVYGHGGSGVIPAWITASRSLGTGFYIGDGSTWLSAVHVDDLAAFYVLALDKARAGDVFNVATESIRAHQVAEAISIGIGAPGQARSLTAEEAAQRFPPTVYIFPFVTFLTTNGKISGEKARTELGWIPRAPSLLTDLSTGSYAVKSSG